jgi:hypothetical protein
MSVDDSALICTRRGNLRRAVRRGVECQYGGVGRRCARAQCTRAEGRAHTAHTLMSITCISNLSDVDRMCVHAPARGGGCVRRRPLGGRRPPRRRRASRPPMLESVRPSPLSSRSLDVPLRRMFVSLTLVSCVFRSWPRRVSSCGSLRRPRPCASLRSLGLRRPQRPLSARNGRKPRISQNKHQHHNDIGLRPYLRMRHRACMAFRRHMPTMSARDGERSVSERVRGARIWVKG